MTGDLDTLHELKESVRAAEIRVAQQRETIARLEELGVATETEKMLLHTLEKQLARLIVECDRHPSRD
jgi:hypothetical protein